MLLFAVYKRREMRRDVIGIFICLFFFRVSMCAIGQKDAMPHVITCIVTVLYVYIHVL